MEISPQTVRDVEFREKKLGGYHQDDVDEFLEQVASGLEIMNERLRLATERAARAEAKAKESSEEDDTLRKTLLLAQRTADQAVREGQEQAARLVASAEAEAAARTSQAEEEARRVVDEANAQASADIARLEGSRRQLDEEVDRLTRYLEEQRQRFRKVLTEAAAGLDRDLTMAERPRTGPATGAPGRAAPVRGNDDDDPETRPPARPSVFDRNLLSELSEHARRDRDVPGRGGS